MGYENREDALAAASTIEEFAEAYEENSRLEDQLCSEMIANLDRARLRGEAMDDIDFAKHVFERHNILDYMILPKAGAEAWTVGAGATIEIGGYEYPEGHLGHALGSEDWRERSYDYWGPGEASGGEES